MENWVFNSWITLNEIEYAQYGEDGNDCVDDFINYIESCFSYCKCLAKTSATDIIFPVLAPTKCKCYNVFPLPYIAFKIDNVKNHKLPETLPLILASKEVKFQTCENIPSLNFSHATFKVHNSDIKINGSCLSTCKDITPIIITNRVSHLLINDHFKSCYNYTSSLNFHHPYLPRVLTKCCYIHAGRYYLIYSISYFIKEVYFRCMFIAFRGFSPPYDGQNTGTS